MERVNNRVVETLTFFQWLNVYESITKKEFNDLSEDIQDMYINKYKNYLK